MSLQTKKAIAKFPFFFKNIFFFNINSLKTFIFSIAYVDNERGSKEKIWFYDTSGIENSNFSNSETIKNYIWYSDAIVLVYSVTDFNSFAILDSFKKLIDRIKEKKEVKVCFLEFIRSLDLKFKNSSTSLSFNMKSIE